MTLFACVTGDLPFKADLLPDLFESILNDPVVFPDSVVISDDLKDLILGLMKKDPEERLTMEQIQQHPWLRLSPLARSKSESKRSVADFSKRISWFNIDENESDVDHSRNR